MKRILLYAPLLCLLAWAACKKNNDIVMPPPPPDPEPFAYTITGLKDTGMERTGTATLIVQVTVTSGDAEDVTLGVAGLPPGVTAMYNPTNSGKAPYGTTIILYADRAAVGTYPLNITGRSTTTSLRLFPFTLTISPYTNEAQNMEGSYTETGSCTQLGPVNHNVLVTTTATLHRINMQGFWSGSYDVYADLDPATKTLVIPTQVNNGATFSGTGNYNDSQMTVNYRIFNTLVNDTCTTMLKR